MKIFHLPDLGEGLPDAEIVEWHVALGDWVKLDQRLVSMETAKAIVEVPSPHEGKIVRLFGQPGDLIQTGAPLVEFENQNAETTSTQPTEKSQAHSAKESHTVAGKLEVGTQVLAEEKYTPVTRKESTIKASPAVRALAQKLNVDLTNVKASGAGGMITTQDVQHAALALEQDGNVEPLKGVRRMMSQIMSQSHSEVVPVTVVEDARLIHWKAGEDISVRLIQAMIEACKKEPALNVWFESKIFGRRLFNEIHLGLAVDTPDGLFLPVIRNAEQLDAKGLRQALETVKQKVHARTTSPDDLKGATISLSNFGKFAGRYANPIVVPPTVAILGAGKIREEMIAYQGEPRVCKVLPLSLTFDHRAVTGGEATRFLGAVVESLEK